MAEGSIEQFLDNLRRLGAEFRKPSNTPFAKGGVVKGPKRPELILLQGGDEISPLPKHGGNHASNS